MAKLRIEQLSAQLKQALAPVYLVSGDETLLVEESADAIRKQAQQEGFSERERYEVDKQFDWDQLYSASASLSLFSSKKIIELRIANGKPGDKGSKALCEYLNGFSEDNCLLIITPKLESSAQRSKWVKSIEITGHWLPIWPINPSQLPRWLEQRLRAAGLSADHATIELLASRTEGNLLAAHQEIEKLKLITVDKHLSAELVAGAVADSARYDIFGLIDKALYGDARGAIKNLQGLKFEGTDATIILWGLAREIRTLLTISNNVSQSQSFARAAKQAGVWDKRQPIIQQALKRLRSTQLQLLLRQANGIDKAIKGLRKTNPWDELLDLTLSLSGTTITSPKNTRLALQG